MVSNFAQSRRIPAETIAARFSIIPPYQTSSSQNGSNNRIMHAQSFKPKPGEADSRAHANTDIEPFFH